MSSIAIQTNLLQESEIDVWPICLDSNTTAVDVLFETLSLDEKLRSSKFHFSKDRDRYVVARGKLRKIISEYLNIDAGQVAFSYNRYGKPFCEKQSGSLQFNISHSKEMALVAVTSGANVGIDIEFINHDIDVMKLAQKAFSQLDASILENLPVDLRNNAFFKGWTRKEAYTKAVGKGFFDDSNIQEVSMLSGHSTISFDVVDGNNIRKWTVTSLCSGGKYSAALAIEGSIREVRYRQRFLGSISEFPLIN